MSGWSSTLARLREGDRDARDRIARLVIGALRASGAYAWADSWDDLVQDVLLTLLEGGPEADDDRAIVSWIRRVSVHRFADSVRKEQGRRRAGAGAAAGWRRNVPFEDDRRAEAAALEEALWHDLSQALDGLDARKRRVLEAKYALGCSDEEGARRLGESLGTYKRLARQALQQLNRVLLCGRDEA